MLPPFDSGEHAFWVGGPDEGFGIEVCLGDEAVDGDLQINDRSEHAALEALARELGEEAFDRVEPGCLGRGEVERPAGMPRQPLAHLWMFVGRIIVDDGVDHFSHRDLLLDRIEEADELLVAINGKVSLFSNRRCSQHDNDVNCAIDSRCTIVLCCRYHRYIGSGGRRLAPGLPKKGDVSKSPLS